LENQSNDNDVIEYFDEKNNPSIEQNEEVGIILFYLLSNILSNLKEDILKRNSDNKRNNVKFSSVFRIS
jgi:hypothetical protein